MHIYIYKKFTSLVNSHVGLEDPPCKFFYSFLLRKDYFSTYDWSQILKAGLGCFVHEGPIQNGDSPSEMVKALT